MPLLPVSRHTRHFRGREKSRTPGGRGRSVQGLYPEQPGWGVRGEGRPARPQAWASPRLAAPPHEWEGSGHVQRYSSKSQKRVPKAPLWALRGLCPPKAHILYFPGASLQHGRAGLLGPSPLCLCLVQRKDPEQSAEPHCSGRAAVSSQRGGSALPERPQCPGSPTRKLGAQETRSLPKGQEYKSRQRGLHHLTLELRPTCGGPVDLTNNGHTS